MILKMTIKSFKYKYIMSNSLNIYNAFRESHEEINHKLVISFTIKDEIKHIYLTNIKGF